jgi:hypothetical protein
MPRKVDRIARIEAARDRARQNGFRFKGDTQDEVAERPSSAGADRGGAVHRGRRTADRVPSTKGAKGTARTTAPGKSRPVGKLESVTRYAHHIVCKFGGPTPHAVFAKPKRSEEIGLHGERRAVCWTCRPTGRITSDITCGAEDLALAQLAVMGYKDR